jgi:hypothetical protein
VEFILNNEQLVVSPQSSVWNGRVGAELPAPDDALPLIHPLVASNSLAIHWSIACNHIMFPVILHYMIFQTHRLNLHAQNWKSEFIEDHPEQEAAARE